MIQDAVTSVTRTSSIFSVRDLNRALAHYHALGFRVRNEGDGRTYRVVQRGDLILHLTVDGGQERRGESSAATMQVDNADALALEWSRPGIGGTTLLPTAITGGVREGLHVDPDDNLIRFRSTIFRPIGSPLGS